MPRRKSTSVQVDERSTAKKQKVAATHKKHRSGQTVHIKPAHAIAYDGKQQYVQEVMAPAAAVTALNNTSQFSFNVENDATGLIKDAVLRFQVRVRSAADGAWVRCGATTATCSVVVRPHRVVRPPHWQGAMQSA